MSIERIIDVKDTNNFGILFHDTKTIERFQTLSGMEGSYKVEYQHHYINLVGRIEVDDQRLDIAIPMALYNYHQEVSGASVEFNLGEVGKADNITMKTAIEKFNEFETTDMYKALIEFGITDWQLVGLNSIHAHPTGVNRFSGTDLRTDIHHPGVNFPLSIGKDIPNFASIIQHRGEHAEIIHTEYRIFSGIEKGERHYAKGRCLTINRGMPEIKAAAQIVIPPGAIDEIFGTIRPQPPAPKTEKKREDFILKDGFENGDAIKIKLFTDEMMKLWKECEFEPDTSNVLKTNVIRGRGRLQNSVPTWQGGRGGKFQGKKKKEQTGKRNSGLFTGDWYDEYETTYPQDTKTTTTKSDDEEPTYTEAISLLIKNGYKESELRKSYSFTDIMEEYWLIKLDEVHVNASEEDAWVMRKTYEYGDKVEYEGETYTMTGSKNGIISVTPPDIAVGIWEEETYNEHDDYDEDQNKIELLESTNVMTREKLEMLSTIDLSILYDEIFG